MKKLLITLLFIIHFPLLQAAIVGSDMYYNTTATPGVYQIVLKLYRDCAGSTICNCNVSLSPSCAMAVNITGADKGSTCYGNSFGTQSLPVVTSVSGFDVVQDGICYKTNCTNCGTRTPGTLSGGVEVFTFVGQINLNSLPDSCCLVRISYGTCCQDTSHSTLLNPGSQKVYSEIIINRCLSNNNINVIGHYPVKLLCSGQDYRFRVKDNFANGGDSLSFNLAPTFTDTNTLAQYVSPYSAQLPFQYAGFPAQSPPANYPNGIKVDPVSGDVFFRPVGTFRANLPIEVNKWRYVNGSYKLAGMVRTNIEINSRVCANSVPEIKAYGYNYEKLQIGSEPNFKVVPGREMCIVISAKDGPLPEDTTYLSIQNYDTLGQNSVVITQYYIPALRSILGPKYDSLKFCWTPPVNTPLNKSYSFLVSALDKSCPLAARAYTLFKYETGHAQIKCNKIPVSCPGDSVKLYTDSLPGLSYQWLRNNIPVLGANKSYLHTMDSGRFVVLTTLSGQATDTSYEFFVSKFPAAKAGIYPQGQQYLCAGDTFYMIAPMGAGYTFQWLRNNLPIPGADKNTYNTHLGGTYKVIYYNGYGCFDTSTSLTVIKDSMAAVKLSYSGIQSLCAGESKWLKGIADTGIAKYWYKDQLMLNTNNQDSILVSQTGNYWYKAVNPHGCIRYSDTLNLTVNPKPVFGNILAPAGNIYPDTIYSYSVADLPGHTYFWTSFNGQLTGGQGTSKVYVKWFLNPSCSLRVKVTNMHNCDSVSQLTVQVKNRPPQIQNFSPDSGTLNTMVTIYGKYFNAINQVSFGDSVATSFVVQNDSVIIAYVGNGNSGNVGVLGTHGNSFLPYFRYYSSVGINEYYGNKSIKIYPNPVADILYIHASDKNAMPKHIKILDMYGQLHTEVQRNDWITEISTENLPSGAYMLSWQVGDKVYYSRFIKY